MHELKSIKHFEKADYYNTNRYSMYLKVPETHLHAMLAEVHSGRRLYQGYASMPTLPNFLGVSSSRQNLPVSHNSKTIWMKVHKIHFSDIFWLICALFGQHFRYLMHFSCVIGGALLWTTFVESQNSKIGQISQISICFFGLPSLGMFFFLYKIL